jgi:hypothetical protein
MSVHAYPFDSLFGDYARALLGLALVGVPLVTLDLGLWVAALGWSLAALFAAFGLRTALRHATRVEISDSCIAVLGPLGASIPWGALEAVKLGYYATRRDGKNGWMQLVVSSQRKRITIDSRIEGFQAIVDRTAREARARRVAVGSTTAANFAALGFDLAANGAQ